MYHIESILSLFRAADFCCGFFCSGMLYILVQVNYNHDEYIVLHQHLPCSSIENPHLYMYIILFAGISFVLFILFVLALTQISYSELIFRILLTVNSQLA